MYTHHETYNERSIFGVLRTVPQDSASDSTFNLARTWLDDCLQNHPSCSVKKSDGTRHPARILDIESLLDNSAIKLIDFPINPISYVTLSYCWGSSVPLKTESHSLTQRQSGIEWSTLPRTFQDAVTITRRLGYRYLWIDSLCIIQDSPPDWQTESSKMADVYENSVVTIATLWASDCNSGCLNQRDISVVSIDHRMPDGVNQTVHVCEAHVHPVILNVPIASCPLYSRAWAFQERILSPRVLHYTDSEVVWECRSDLKCECGSIEFGMEVSSLERSKDLRETLYSSVPTIPYSSKLDLVIASNYSMPIGSLSPMNGLRLWRMLVSEYCMRDLTFDADKLPAMSGIGKRLCRLEWGSYFAGLWEAELLLSLLWESINAEEGLPSRSPAFWRRNRSPYRAPSWSWASTDDPITFNFLNRPRSSIEARVDTVQVTLAGRDPTGQVKDGHIILTPPMIRVRWEEEREASSIKDWEDYMNLFIDGSQDIVNTQLAHLPPDFKEHTGPDIQESCSSDALMLVPISVAEGFASWKFPKAFNLLVVGSKYWLDQELSKGLSERLSDAWILYFIVLVESEEVPGAYERVGVCRGYAQREVVGKEPNLGVFAKHAKMTTVKIV